MMDVVFTMENKTLSFSTIAPQSDTHGVRIDPPLYKVNYVFFNTMFFLTGCFTLEIKLRFLYTKIILQTSLYMQMVEICKIVFAFKSVTFLSCFRFFFNSVVIFSCKFFSSTIIKIFSREPLTSDIINKLFITGTSTPEYTSVPWYAYPHYTPPEKFLPFQLDDGVFHVNAIERASSAMEMVSIGGRNVALLAHQYLQQSLMQSNSV